MTFVVETTFRTRYGSAPAPPSATMSSGSSSSRSPRPARGTRGLNVATRLEPGHCKLGASAHAPPERRMRQRRQARRTDWRVRAAGHRTGQASLADA